MLDPEITFLNHGCFGARLHPVWAAQQRWREAFEARPVEFLDRGGGELLAAAKSAIGAFLGMTPENFGMTTNATDGVNAVLRSLTFAAGDEIATTSHVYSAVRQTMRYLVERTGAAAVEIDVPLPCPSPGAVVAAIAGGLTERTRVLVIDHISSSTAVRFPIEAILRLCDERGIDVLVDGAHAPGMIDLDIERLGAAYYAGNLHKWVCAPPGAAFLWVRPDRRAAIHPNVISHYLGDGLAAEFAWQGTRDVSSWLTVPDAIAAMDGLVGPGSWPRIRLHNHALARWAQARLCAAWGIEPATPLDGSMLGSMVGLRLPDRLRERWTTPQAAQAHLYDQHRIEVPIFEHDDGWIMRASCQIYNAPGEYERLAAAVGGMLGG